MLIFHKAGRSRPLGHCPGSTAQMQGACFLVRGDTHGTRTPYPRGVSPGPYGGVAPVVGPPPGYRAGMICQC